MPTNAQAVAQKLLQHGCHITFAESCTAGLCAARLGEIPNISHIFDQSFVTYANEAKIALLGVDPALIEQYGVVSEPVALQMAIGASARTGAQVAVGISGIAGPGGGSEEKPVGMVCIGYTIGEKQFSQTCRFGDIGRNAVREAAVDTVYAVLNENL
ncbi:MAG: CinA family protein [Ruminococcaceae bacterium]|nr:CinA family protein [Oscillospiraceae bacterium]